MRQLRSLTALILGFFATGFATFVDFVFAVFRQCSARVRGTRLIAPYPGALRLWATTVHEYITEPILGVRVFSIGGITPLKSNEIGICVANHPSTAMAATWAHEYMRTCGNRTVVVAKNEQLWNPIGWALAATGAGIFVDRSSAEKSRASIRAALSSEKTPPFMVLIFPDMRRAKQSLIALDREKFREKIPGIDTWLRYTLAPRAGGTHEIVSCLAGLTVRYFTITAACTANDEGYSGVFRAEGNVYMMRFEEIAPLPTDPHELREWLNAEWKKKNDIIHGWRVQ